MILLIDAISRGSGGSKRHLTELLKFFSKNPFHFDKIIIWAPSSLLNILPNHKKILKRTHFLLNYGWIGFLLWQLFLKNKSFNGEAHCIFSPFGNYTGKNHPYVTMSRNMLMFEKKERKRNNSVLTRLKYKFLYYTNKKSFENADGMVFLSNYARNVISSKIKLKNIDDIVINHGISNSFIKKPKVQKNINSYSDLNPYKILYVSHVFPYKHHLNVIYSIINLKKEGYNISLTLVGSNQFNTIGKKIKSILKDDEISKYINWEEDISLDEVKKFYHNSDCFIFASSCENMPNSLIEAMSSGLPIICSNLGPMKEFLKDAGEYFNPLSETDLTKKLKKVIKDKNLRKVLAKKAHIYSSNYSWEKCAKQTFDFIKSISIKYSLNKLNI